MGDAGSQATKLYLTDEYIQKNPTLHEEDSPWKVGLIKPFVDSFIGHLDHRREINLLDVGGGAGVILSDVAEYIESAHKVSANKFALDLSPGMLEIQKGRNPDLRRALHADIHSAPLKDKEIDLTLMIDVLEHVPEPAAALQEVRRFSKFILLKVPLEDNLYYNFSDFIRRGKVRQHHIDVIGHINVYRWSTLRKELEAHAGRIVGYRFTNVFEYFLTSAQHREEMKMRTVLLNQAAARTYRLSPRLCSLLFYDFAMALVECD
jgi:SAM-dependent methyltransferase